MERTWQTGKKRSELTNDLKTVQEFMDTFACILLFMQLGLKRLV